LIRNCRYSFQDVIYLKGIGMNKKYIVRLTADEREELEDLVKKGKTQAFRIKHANILLAVDADGPNWPDHQAAKAYKCHQNTVVNVRQRFVEQGFQAALERKKQRSPSRKRIIDGESEARLLSIACSKPPEGYAKWTMQMLADELVALKVVDSVSGQTVWRTLKKTNLNLT
jgi:transposase